jgi:hypothetical protein
MKGLNYADATDKMLFLNHSSPVQRAEHAFPRAHPHRQRS